MSDDDDDGFFSYDDSGQPRERIHYYEGYGAAKAGVEDAAMRERIVREVRRWVRGSIFAFFLFFCFFCFFCFSFFCFCVFVFLCVFLCFCVFVFFVFVFLCFCVFVGGRGKSLERLPTQRIRSGSGEQV